MIQRKGKITKADRSSVVSDLTGRGLTLGGDATETEPQPAVESVQAPVAAPAAQPQPAPAQPAPAEVAAAPVDPPAPAAAPAGVAAPVAQASVPTEAPAPAPAKKNTGVKVGFYQRPEEGDAMRAAFIATRHITKHRTLSDFICSVVAAEVARLEKEYNGGEPFETEPDGVPRGRPIG